MMVLVTYYHVRRDVAHRTKLAPCYVYDKHGADLSRRRSQVGPPEGEGLLLSVKYYFVVEEQSRSSKVQIITHCQ